MSIMKVNGSRNYRCQFMIDGKTYVKSTKTSSKKLALEIEKQYRQETLERIKLGVKDRITLKDALDLYESEKENMKSFSTTKIYIQWVRNYFKNTNYLDDLKSSDLERMCFARRKEGKSEQVVRYCVLAIRGAHKLSAKLGYQTADLTFPETDSSEEKTRFLSPAEEEKLLDLLNPANPLPTKHQKRAEQHIVMQQDLYDIVVTLLDTGARKSEITTLTWDRVDFQNRRIMVYRSKVENESYVPLTRRLYNTLFKRFQDRKSEHWVFPSPKNVSKPRTSLHKAFDNVVTLAQLEGVTLHTLRHTYASKLAQSGLSLQKIASLLGHSDVKTTTRYAHLVHDNLVDEARELLDQAG